MKQFGGKEHILSAQCTAHELRGEHGTDLLLRAINEGRVDVPVSHLQREGNGPIGFFRKESKEVRIGRNAAGIGVRLGTIAEAGAGGDDRHFDSIGQSDGWYIRCLNFAR